MQEYELDLSGLGSGQIFPRQISDQDWIGYHATASYYSKDIESNGFESRKIFSDKKLDLIVSSAEKLGLDCSKVNDFRQMASSSFSPLSELCLSYSNPESLGGQGVGFINNLSKEILEHEKLDIDANETKTIQSIIDEISNIRSTLPIIYAVNLHALERIVYNKFTRAIHVYEKVTPDRVIAKIPINDPTLHKSVDIKAMYNKIDNLVQNGYYITQIQR